ncbi:MAG: amidohydrolase family protein [Desulfuromonadales bacterium]|nr:amidohydrolase family protein [Desulfuromonadales bacterium]
MKRVQRIPLLKDHHSHPFLYATLAHCPDISSVSNKSEALSRIRGSFSGEEIAVVMGWNDSYFGFAECELDLFPPLVIFNISLHSLLINVGAREMLVGTFPELVANFRDGAWVERNTAQVLNFILSMKPCSAGQLKSYFHRLARLGVWHAEEMSLKGAGEIELFRAASLLDRTRFRTDLTTFETMTDAGQEQIYGIKLFADGALGARSARLEQRYLSGAEGVLVYADEELFLLISRVFDVGKALAVHAIGDTAVDQVVRVLEQVANGRQGLGETRVEHCQFISPHTARKAKSLGITLCMQPNFSLDSLCYRDRLPQGYCRLNNPFRMLLDEAGYAAGEDLLLGSDGMPHGVHCALESALFPPFPGQVLTLDEFVAGYCMSDYDNGYIDVVIDDVAGKVETQVVLKEL